MFGGRCPLNIATTFSAAIHAIFVRVSIDADAMCGASTTLGLFNPGRMNGSFSNTSSAAPAIFPLSSASTKAASSTTAPRDVLIKYAVGFILENRGASNNRASRARAARARSQSPPPTAGLPSPDIPPSILSPPLLARATRPRKLLSFENRAPAAPSLFRSVRIPQFPASCPTHLRPRADPSPSLSSSQTAPTRLLPPAAALPPSSKSTQNPPSSRPTHPGCSSPLLRAWCKPQHQYCRSPPPHSPQSAVSAPR